MILSYLFFIFLAYLLFRLVVNFIIPVYKTTKQVKQKFREMNQRMQGQPGGEHTPRKEQKDNVPNKKSTLGEYIDFEEVKE